jgi:hypothetical protein
LEKYKIFKEFMIFSAKLRRFKSMVDVRVQRKPDRFM